MSEPFKFGQNAQFEFNDKELPNFKDDEPEPKTKAEKLTLIGRLREENKAVIAECDRLTQKWFYKDLALQNTTSKLLALNEQFKKANMDIDTLQKRAQELTHDVEREQGAREHAEKGWTEVTKELEGASKKTKEAEEKLATAKTANEEYEKTIKALEEQIGEQDTAATQHEATIAELRAKLQAANENIEAEKRKTERESEATAAVTRDNVGVSRQLTDTRVELDNVKRERDELQAKQATREQTEADLEEARDTINALEDQIEKLKADNQRRPFDVQPTAHIAANPTIGTTIPVTPTLQEELGIGGSSTPSYAQSEDESEHGDHDSLPELTSEDDTVKLGQTEIVPPPLPVTVTVTVPRNVYTPYQVSAHNPLLCWIQTELNFLILFSVWLTWASGRVSSSLQRRLQFPGHSVPPADNLDVPSPDNMQPSSGPQDVPASDDFHIPPSADVDASQDTPPTDALRIQAEIDQRLSEASAAIPPLEKQTDTREVFGERIRPAPDSHNPIIFAQTSDDAAASAGIPSPSDPAAIMLAGLGGSQDRPWYTKIISPLPGDKPSVSKTLYGLAFHLIIYYCIGMGYLCYRERTMWLDANDRTRVFLLQLLHNPHAYSSFLHRMTFALPEDWKHSIDVFVFKYFVEKFGLHASIAMPG